MAKRDHRQHDPEILMSVFALSISLFLWYHRMLFIDLFQTQLGEYQNMSAIHLGIWISLNKCIEDHLCCSKSVCWYHPPHVSCTVLLCPSSDMVHSHQTSTIPERLMPAEFCLFPVPGCSLNFHQSRRKQIILLQGFQTSLWSFFNVSKAGGPPMQPEYSHPVIFPDST